MGVPANLRRPRGGWGGGSRKFSVRIFSVKLRKIYGKFPVNLRTLKGGGLVGGGPINFP